MGDSRIFPPDSANYKVVLGHLIEKSPYCRVLRKYEQQIGLIAVQNPQVSSALARICAGRARNPRLGEYCSRDHQTGPLHP